MWLALNAPAGVCSIPTLRLKWWPFPLGRARQLWRRPTMDGQCPGNVRAAARRAP